MARKVDQGAGLDLSRVREVVGLKTISQCVRELEVRPVLLVLSLAFFHQKGVLNQIFYFKIYQN